MADRSKLSVEKALNKIRENEQRNAGGSRLDDETESLNEEIRRMKAQRLRLDQQPGKRG